MTPETARLQHGPQAGETEPGDLVSISFECPDGAEITLIRVREVLRPVIDAPKQWPPTDTWREILPDWFVEACSDDERVTTCVVDRWSLRAWVWWFQPEQRRWLWWDAHADGVRLRIRVVPTGVGSLLLGTLEWLVKVAGGRPVAAT